MLNSKLEELSLTDAAHNVESVISEQVDRTNRSRNIIIFNLPELNKSTPTDDNEKKDFFKELTQFNKNSICNLLKTLDPSIEEPAYFKRLGKYSSNKIRPLLLSFKDPSSLKSIFINLTKLKSSSDYKLISIKHDLTSTQRKSVNDLKAKCVELNKCSNNNDFHWTVSFINSVPKIVKRSKN